MRWHEVSQSKLQVQSRMERRPTQDARPRLYHGFYQTRGMIRVPTCRYRIKSLGTEGIAADATRVGIKGHWMWVGPEFFPR